MASTLRPKNDSGMTNMTNNVHTTTLRTIGTAKFETHFLVKARPTVLTSDGSEPIVLFACITRDIQSVYDEKSDSICTIEYQPADMPDLQFVIPVRDLRELMRDIEESQTA